ncbi:MAG: C_GCAxxG_C_C family protein, partial [Clostridia bacterium]|nr:C_GCAxxG_C_C family protein [Clostridia bacterium]
MDHVQKARELFVEGYNCAQAVFAAFCDVTGMDFNTALKLSSSFGGGMG